MLVIDYTRLSQNDMVLALDIAEYAYPKTPEGAASLLDTWLVQERITKATYDEIKQNVTFLIDDAE